MALRRKVGKVENNGVQTELDDLQRRYRMMEVNRKTYNEDSQNTIRIQRNQIDKLKKDNDRLKEDLALETRQAKNANNLTASTQIAKLQEESDKYAGKIAAEKRKISELDEEIKKMQNTILQQRKDMGGINATKETNQAVQRQIRILENRLDKALVKFNEALAHNKQLRETIDNLRRERLVFDGIYKKLERELFEKKNKMADIIEVSNSAYEARDAAQAEMVSLKAQADREQQEFEAKWRDLGELIERDRKGKDAPKSPKDRDRATSVVVTADPALEEEAKLRKRVNKGAFGIAKDKASITASMEKVQSYEDAFAKIQQATKISDIDVLVQTFVNAEEHNFQLFNQVNDLSTEIEKMEENIGEIRAEIQKYKGQQDGTVDNQRKRILDDLEQQLTRTESKALQYEEKYAQAMSTVNALKSGIGNIFEKIAPNDGTVSEMLGNAGVTESNMMQYLGMIEQRTNELLQLYHQQQLEQPAFNNPNQHNQVTIQAPSSVEPPTSEQHDDSDGEEEKPISIEEMNRIAKRTSGSLSNLNLPGAAGVAAVLNEQQTNELNQLSSNADAPAAIEEPAASSATAVNVPEAVPETEELISTQPVNREQAQ